MKSILLFIYLLVFGNTFAQSKILLYYNEYWWLQPSNSKSITYYRKCTVDKLNGGFIGKVEDYEKVGNSWVLIMKGNFGTKKEHVRHATSSGTVFKEYDEVHHRYDGNFVYYFRDGNKKSEGKFANGDRMGIWKFFHGNGQLKCKILYEERGKWTILESYNRAGEKVEKESLYIHDLLNDPKVEYEAMADHRDLKLMKEFPFLKNFRDNTYEKDLVEELRSYEKDDGKPIFIGIDFEVGFPGGYENYLKMLRGKIIYPEQALKDKIEGSVLARIIVGNDGSIENVVFLNDIGGGCNDEVKRVILGWQPKFRPARKQNKLVRRFMYVAVYFELP